MAVAVRVARRLSHTRIPTLVGWQRELQLGIWQGSPPPYKQYNTSALLRTVPVALDGVVLLFHPNA